MKTKKLDFITSWWSDVM